jgi:hypothetical protein
MKATTFDKHKTQEILFYTKEPVLNILKIQFVSPDNKDWVTQIHGASLLIKISALGDHYKELASKESILSFSTFIEPFHIQPVLITDQTFSFNGEASAKYQQWKIEITLTLLAFKENESLSIFYTDSI